jgi:hypothetical protein
MFGPAVSAIREARGALELTFFGTFAPGGRLPDLEATAAYGELIWAQQAELQIAPSGEVQNCRMTRSVSDATGAFPFVPRAEMCAFFRMGAYRFEPDTEATTTRQLDVSHSYRIKRRQ